MKLTNENYFSKEAGLYYMGSSQFKAFKNCEASALAEVRGELIKPASDALLVGSYVDAYFSNEFDEFTESHPDLYTKAGELRARYKTAESCIARAEKDPLFMEYISGEMQPIETGEIEGVPVKIKIDALHADKIVDLKCMRNIEPVKTETGLKTFIDYYGYDIQAYIYQTVHAQNTGQKLPFYFAVITKETSPDLEIIHLPQWRINQAGEVVRHYIKRFDLIKKGEIKPERCGRCAYCKATKRLVAPIEYEDLYDR